MNLTGIWTADDGGIYYIRQIGSQVWWAGLGNNGGGQNFTNVFRGTMTSANGLTEVVGTWADVPRGSNDGYGNLSLNVLSTTKIVKLSGGGFFASIWTKQ